MSEELKEMWGVWMDDDNAWLETGDEGAKRIRWGHYWEIAEAIAYNIRQKEQRPCHRKRIDTWALEQD